ncbi:MAG: cytochrome c oxidase subunit II [Gammaproteobacteria bacterium]|nr:cytochrome c oxidase subunit II [Gammaproteobacteria bacterium]
MNRSKAYSGWIIAALAATTLCAAGPAAAEWALDFPASATELGGKIRGLHHTALIICVVIGVIVFGVLGYSLMKFRKSQGAQPAKFSHSTKAEVIWTVIPVLILVGLAIPSARVLIEMEDTQSADLRVVVTGYQWKWRYEYPDHGISFFSNMTEESKAAAIVGAGHELHEHYLRDVDNPMVVPAGRKVKLQLTSNDVIHAWWIPDLYVKRDAVPGTINETWFEVGEPGVYRGQCAELCGRGHGFMPIVVEALPPEEFDAWAAAQTMAGSSETALKTASVAVASGPNAQ